MLRWLADRRGFLLLAPPSRGRTWDVIEGGYGPDVRFIAAALDLTFQRCNPGANPIAVAGLPALKREGRRVVYREFHGGHTIPAEVTSESIDLFFAVSAPCGNTER